MRVIDTLVVLAATLSLVSCGGGGGGGGGGSPDAIWILNPVLHSRDTKGSGDGNYGDTKHPRLDELTDAIEGEMDPAKRNAMVHEAVKLVASAPFGGPVTVLAGGAEHAISRELAGQIGVS